MPDFYRKRNTGLKWVKKVALYDFNGLYKSVLYSHLLHVDIPNNCIGVMEICNIDWKITIAKRFEKKKARWSVLMYPMTSGGHEGGLLISIDGFLWAH